MRYGRRRDLGAPGLDDLVLEWAQAEHRVAAEEKRLDRLSWHQLLERREAHKHVLAARERAGEILAALPTDGLETFARTVVLGVWQDIARRHMPKRHPYHLDLERLRSASADDVAAAAAARTVVIRRYPFSMIAGQVPGFTDMVTTKFVARTLDAEAAHVRTVVEDPVMLVDHISHGYPDDDPGGSDGFVMVVQHQASGLRAMFNSRPDGFGGVGSKAHSIGSIDPDRPGPAWDWGRFAGLGIGTRVYLAAALRRPDVRWEGSPLTEYSTAVRRKLHAHDPYSWSASCTWCTDRAIDWRQAVPGDFAGHPRQLLSLDLVELKEADNHSSSGGV